METEKPLISIIIPCFRQGRYLARSVDSALTQTYRPLEVVVVNDGSDDETDMVAKSYGDRITYLETANRGVSAARNSGIEVARGKFLVFLDADDILHTEAIAWLMEATGGNEETVGIIGFSRFHIEPGDDDSPAQLPPSSMNSFLPWLFQYAMPLMCHLCPRQVVLEAGSFVEGMKYNEDYDLWWRLARLEVKTVSIARIGAYYRRNPAGASTNEAFILARAQITLQQYEEVMRNPQWTTKYGSDLLRTIYAMRRRLRVRGIHAVEAQSLTAAIRDLHAKGVRVEEPLPVKIQDRLPEPLADLFERLGLVYYRIFQPKIYSSFVNC